MIYLARHGETEFNAAGRFQGQRDSPLTSCGRDQALRMGQILGGLIDPAKTIIFSSPLGRARQTAEIVAAAAAISREIIFDADLMEIGMGSWDGLTGFEIDHEWPGARDGTDRYDWFFRSPDGETLAGFAKRVSTVLARISASPVPIRIVVSHGVTGRIIRGKYEGLDDCQSLHLDAPQDAIFRLDDRKVQRISTMPLGLNPEVG